MLTEPELLRLLNDGDEKVVRSIFDRYYDSLCLYAESIIKDHHAAEEIVEDIFIHFWLNAKDIQIYQSLKSYLFRSVHNNCLKYLDKHKSEKQNIDSLNYLLEDHEITEPVSLDYAFSNIVAQELEEKAVEVLESLPEQCKKIYYLNRFENLSYTEIAERLNITVGTVKTQMSRAFQKFRINLIDYLPLLIILIFWK
ncbi:MAG: RNA polymerase sigma-70 factor [Bacteroidota bacterium]|nr:RNA polymerase sigma-70 factor [Bacteroidota bacterium]MDP4228295.1 RNA polymerase sigma-70 factor [Bacteroidota bacterium]MDP4275611.1 RNA polymerase sigma-70 factor [Bacteroidota bacterium]